MECSRILGKTTCEQVEIEHMDSMASSLYQDNVVEENYIISFIVHVLFILLLILIKCMFIHSDYYKFTFSGGGGAKPSKFPAKLSNFRQTPPFALEKAVFSPPIGQNFRKFVIFQEVGAPPHRDFRHWMVSRLRRSLRPPPQKKEVVSPLPLVNSIRDQVKKLHDLGVSAVSLLS